jgi:hypothetical protein
VPDRIDLSKATIRDLEGLHSNVLRQLAVRLRDDDEALTPHDSHSSSHSKNSIVDRPQDLGRQQSA